jgi:hypothetical protein
MPCSFFSSKQGSANPSKDLRLHLFRHFELKRVLSEVGQRRRGTANHSLSNLHISITAAMPRLEPHGSFVGVK